MAIGNKGQNARLAAKLTGWKIDIRPESGFFGEDEEPVADEKSSEINDDTIVENNIESETKNQEEASKASSKINNDIDIDALIDNIIADDMFDEDSEDEE